VSYTPTILVLDSGLGGLTVQREIVNVLPAARYIYVADDAFFPYGRLSEDDIIARVVPLVGQLIGTHAPDIVVIACNTMSVSVLGPLRAAYSVPFVGTVPAIKPACAASKTKRVSVLGTRATVQREYTQALIRNHAQACTVTLVGATCLASLAEDALSGKPVSDADIRSEIAPCFVPAGHGGDNLRTDAVVLACTHYPLLLDRFLRLAPWPVSWIDPAPAIARRVFDLLGASDNGGREFPPEMIFTSGRSHTLTDALAPFFGGRVPARSTSHQTIPEQAVNR
jgi:glutamate racemase